MQKETLNYLWIGDPRSSLGNELGSDLKDVAQASSKVNNPISFYCLEKHIDTYRAIVLNQGINITVESVDKHLDKISKGDSPLRL